MTDLPGLQMEITTTFHYEAAHWLPKVRRTHKCGRMHGHSYELQVTLRGPVDLDSGWVIDFADVKDKVNPWLKCLDHHTLNDEIPNPTVEAQLAWWWLHLYGAFPDMLWRLRLQETPNNFAVMERPE